MVVGRLRPLEALVGAGRLLLNHSFASRQHSGEQIWLQLGVSALRKG